MRLSTIRFLVLAGLLVLAPPAQAKRYGWSISNSETDPFSNTGNPTYAVTKLYLWLQCCDTDGMSAAEFDIETSSISLLATTTQNGFLNAGGTSNVLLAVGGCPCGPMVAAELLVVDSGGTVCLVESAENSIRASVDCETLPELWPIDWIGYSSAGPDPCGSGRLCRSELLDDSSWSEIKGLYRR
jgi:hypothetical protein